eukprot:TRINITY_DN10642_c0_g1_i1.p1 TRINITY_DN10642_c0_g1~~TRINITY_DN10642_c0_g1_i1.p1  ORF type:complete len:429 (-),score=28.76 TRINITY_DN10642_c0_g1_i1:539-1825(-)
MEFLVRLCRKASVSFASCVLVLVLSSSMEFISASSSVGINYGRIADNLPSPGEAREILLASNLTSIRIYDADPGVLNALRGTGIEIVVSLGNEYVVKMSTRADKALQWVEKNVQAYLPSTKITGILVGNEVYTDNSTDVKEYLLGALKNIHTALVQLNLDSQVTASTAHSYDIFAASFPPSSCTFKESLMPQMKELLSFLSAAKAPFLVNAYPYFAYKGDPTNIPLAYVLFKENNGVVDEKNGLHYDNMLYAQIDAAYAALANAGFGDLELRVSETGWPSKGDENEAGASPENAKQYNGNLLQRLRKGEGTPLKPDVKVQAYIFALFNEDMKPGPTSERNYGLFKPDGTEAYSVGLKGLKQLASTSPTASSGSGSGSAPNSVGPVASSSPSAYSYSYSYTSAAPQEKYLGSYAAVCIEALGIFLLLNL